MSKKIIIEFTAFELLTVHGNVCLGLRHPYNTGPSRKTAENFVLLAEENLKKCGFLTDSEIRLIHRVENEETKKIWEDFARNVRD